MEQKKADKPWYAEREFIAFAGGVVIATILLVTGDTAMGLDVFKWVSGAFMISRGVAKSGVLR